VSNTQLHNDYRKPRTFWNWCLREELAANNTNRAFKVRKFLRV